MNELFYIIIRVFYRGASETHSVEIKTDRRQATQRFYNIIASDLADDTITYQYCEIRDCYGNDVDGLHPVVYDRRTPAT